MKYDISKPSAPAMPTLGKGTECIRLMLTQASKDMHEPLVPMFFPVLGAHISGAEFQYPDLSWKETCGKMANPPLSSLIGSYPPLSAEPHEKSPYLCIMKVRKRKLKKC